jgi:rod shape-determining protein MreD
MTRPRIYAILFLFVAIEVSVLDWAQISGAKPDLVLILVMFAGLFLGPSRGLETGIAGGILKDLFSAGLFGMNAFVFGLTGFLIGVLNNSFFRESDMNRFFLVFIASVFAMALRYAAFLFVTKNVNITFADYLATSVLPVCLYTVIVAVPVFRKLLASSRFKEEQEFL